MAEEICDDEGCPHYGTDHVHVKRVSVVNSPCDCGKGVFLVRKIEVGKDVATCGSCKREVPRLMIPICDRCPRTHTPRFFSMCAECPRRK